MKVIDFKKIVNKSNTVGGWISLNSNQLNEMMIDYFDWIVVDLEHSTLSLSDAENIIRLATANKKPCLVRISQKTESEIKSLLDAGASGIIAPQISSLEEAQEIIKKMYYPPVGERGVGLYRAHNYGEDFAYYSQFHTKGLTFIPQIEDYKGVDDLLNIINNNYVHGFLIGPYDLSASLGCRGDFKNPKFLKYMKKVNAFKTKKLKGFHLVHYNKKDFLKLKKNNYNLIAVGSDILLFSEKIKDLFKKIKE